MKKLIALISLGLCLSILPNTNTLTTLSAENETHTVKLVLTPNGLYNGSKGNDSETLFLENYVEFSGVIGTALPNSDIVTNSVSGVTFDSWIVYEKGSKVPVSTIDGIHDLVYASWINDGTAGKGTITEDTGGNVGGDINPDIPQGDSDWYVVGKGSFVKGAEWSADGGVRLSTNKNPTYSDSEYFVTGLYFSIGDEWKITNPKTGQWIETGWEANGYGSAIDNGQMIGADNGMGGTNVKVLVAGNYDIYLKLWNDGGSSVWIAKSN
jgi:hypothetical protein